MGRNPYANSILCTYEIQVWREEFAGAEVKKLRTVLRKFSNGTMAPAFEKRRFYSRGPDFYVGNQMGLNRDDIQFIVDNAPKILETLVIGADTLAEMTQSEKIMPDGRVMLDGKIYDMDKFYPKK
jgi:hypothetical protein